MAIRNELEMKITAAWIAPRGREWVVERQERDHAAQQRAAIEDVLDAERDDLDRLANGTRGVLRRIVVG